MTVLRSVRGRITAVATLLVATVLLIFSVFVLRMVEDDVRAAAEEALATALETQAELIGGADQPIFFDVVIDGQAFGLGLFTEGDDGEAFGELFVGQELLAMVEIDLETREITQILDPDTGTAVDNAQLRSELQQLTFDILDVDGDAGSSLLVGATELEEIEASTTAVRRALLLSVPLVLVAFAAMTWWLVGRSLRPVHAISEEVQAITTHSLNQRVSVPQGKDEVAELATVMNLMLDRLQVGDSKQRQFSADASHELRSPLATVRAAAEMIERKPEGLRTGELAGHIVAESERMETLIGDLLGLARSEQADTSATFDVLDLAELTSECLDGSATAVEAEQAVSVQGNVSELRRVVLNLVENAQRHAASQVLVQVRSSGQEAVLSVDDDGPGIPAHDRELVFERFTRLDNARARDGGGAGLGLALVHAIVNRHGGSISAGDSPRLGGARFEVRLPLVAADPAT